MLKGPKEGYATKIAEKKWRIADGSKASTDIGNDEDKKNDVVSCDPISIHSYPRANQKHGGSCRSEKIRKKCAQGQKANISNGCGGSCNTDPDSP
jgi:hypothetical protein